MSDAIVEDVQGARDWLAEHSRSHKTIKDISLIDDAIALFTSYQEPI